jgi:hypothetical protein
MMLISEPESCSKFVLVFKSGETILAVGVFGVSVICIETIRRGLLRNLNPIHVHSSCMCFHGFPSPVVIDSPGFPFVSVHDCTMVLL